MNDDLRIFVPILKKDNDKKEVYGYASTEALDSQGEVVEKDAVVKALPGYLGEVDPTTGRFRFGNVREMHQPSAVGKAIRVKIDEKGLFLGAKIVDKNAWEKVKEGVYAGYSIGGRVIKKIGNRIKDIKLTEISLVDRPANPDAVFSMVKIDDAGKIEDMQKQLELVATPEEMPFEEVMEAGRILDFARDLRMLLNMFHYEGRSTIELEKALTALKTLAQKILNGENKEKFERILYGIDFAELDKGKLPYKERKNMPAGEFAYIDSDGGKHLPIHDVAHVRNALARFNQTQFESPEKKKAAARKILAAARKYKIEVSEDSAVYQTAKKAEIDEIVDYINSNWQPGYFAKQREVLG